MPHPIPLHLPDDVLISLVNQVDEGWYGPKSEAALCQLIRGWVASQPGAAGLAEAAAAPAVAPEVGKGYQWKQLFLPNGTELRTTFGGKSTYAQVQDEVILSSGNPTTPSRLANASGCGTRNAWHNIWVRFPGESTWKLARRCRPPA
ncbi:hypothetical protein [Duganella vulcania]|uniref:DUF2924 domain-containing protein n=1 Tax=Duganella vulcania TaxID=2692166 RepID=A0A845GWJ6_9BURK|nr:hypothetical protein [Duganella vulcania]MYM98823.1 hypothetical protein [Duganella vulcania]